MTIWNHHSASVRLVPAVLAGGAVALAGCANSSPQGQSSAQPTVTVTTTSTVTPSTTPAVTVSPSASSPESTGRAAARPSTPSPGSAIGKCTNDEVVASVTAQSGGGEAGRSHYWVSVRNVSKHACTLLGYPGVDVLDSHGKQIGASAQHSSRGTSPRRIVLRPGSTSRADLTVSNAGAHDCTVVTVRGVAVWVPGTTSPAKVTRNDLASTQTCKEKSAPIMEVTRFQ